MLGAVLDGELAIQVTESSIRYGAWDELAPISLKKD